MLFLLMQMAEASADGVDSITHFCRLKEGFADY